MTLPPPPPGFGVSCRASAGQAFLSASLGTGEGAIDTRLVSALKPHSTLHGDFGNIPIQPGPPSSHPSAGNIQTQLWAITNCGQRDSRGVAPGWAENASDEASEDGDGETKLRPSP